MLQDLGSDHLPILLSVPLSPVFRLNERPPFFNFQKARWDDFDSHCPSAEVYSSLSSTAALFTPLALDVAKSSIPFDRIKRPPKAWWSAEVEGVVSERCKAFAAIHRGDEDCQACISAYRRASSVIGKAKAEVWQMTCSSFSPKSNPKTVLRSIAGSSSSSSFSPNFPNCFSPRESASVFAAYLRSHFSVSQPKALRSRARGYLCKLCRPEESHSSFCSPFSPTELLAVACNLSSSTATGPDKVAYPMLKRLPRFDMIFFFTSSTSPGLRIPFLPSGRPLPLLPSIRWESLSTLLLPSGLSLSPSAYQSFLNTSYHLVYSFFWNLISFSLPARPVSALDGLHSIKFCTFLSPFRMGVTYPGRALGRFSLLLIFRKLSTLCGTPPFSINSFRLASLLALLDGLNLSFLICALACLSKSQKSFLSSLSRCSARIRSWPCTFLSFHQ